MDAIIFELWVMETENWVIKKLNSNGLLESPLVWDAGFFHQTCSKQLLDLQQKLQNQAEWPKLGNELLEQDLIDRQALWAEIEMSPTGLSIC